MTYDEIVTHIKINHIIPAFNEGLATPFDATTGTISSVLKEASNDRALYDTIRLVARDVAGAILNELRLQLGVGFGNEVLYPNGGHATSGPNTTPMISTPGYFYPIDEVAHMPQAARDLLFERIRAVAAEVAPDTIMLHRREEE